MKSQLTPEEYDSLLLDDLVAGGKRPLIYKNVSRGYLSIARYSGGAWINGCYYVYNPVTDELLRKDAVKSLANMRKADKPELPAQTQGSLI